MKFKNGNENDDLIGFFSFFFWFWFGFLFVERKLCDLDYEGYC